MGCDSQRDSHLIFNLCLPVLAGNQEVVQVETLEMADILLPAEGVDQDPLEVSAHRNSMFVCLFFLFVIIELSNYLYFLI